MRRRLLILVAATTSLVLVAFFVPLAFLVQTMAADRVTGAAIAQLQSLAPVVATADQRTIQQAIAQVDAATGHPITIFLPNGETLGAAAVPSAGAALAAQGRSITVDTSGGREVLVAVQGVPEGTAVIRAFVPDDELRQGVSRAWLILALLGLLLMAVGLVVADQLARSLVRPISDLAAVSHRLARGNLAARITPAGPAELRNVGAAFNQLASRITELLAQERERVADISHRLRTPLTALRLEADGLRDPEESSRLRDGVDAMERAITRVIADARRPVRTRAWADAATTVHDRVEFWSVLAEDQDRPVQRDIAPGPLPVALSVDELTDCVDALLGNVFAHTSEGTAFAVRLTPRPGGGVRLKISDTGPGFPGTDAARRGTSGVGSTGLGLDIAHRAASRSGGSFRLGPAPGGGALVVLELGPPPGDAEPEATGHRL
ncbi:MAG TPA: HAMP domain-containing sensor histidine kinase [Micromonospora sp.]|nr:HAMP domain-containing sensor histidine kinase [Micromonospora sp.]